MISAPLFRLKRNARQMSRAEGIPLHAALDQLARKEGFQSWSHLTAARQAERPAQKLLARLEPGDLVLLGARPGHGKTLFGLSLLAESALAGRQGHFFTLEETEAGVLEKLKGEGYRPSALRTRFHLDMSEEICAAHICGALAGAPAGTVAVIDYLQLLDQRRSTPPLADQLSALKAFAQASGVILAAISQVSRGFEDKKAALPGLADVRLPNPADLSLFSRTCFLHDGQISLQPVP